MIVSILGNEYRFDVLDCQWFAGERNGVVYGETRVMTAGAEESPARPPTEIAIFLDTPADPTSARISLRLGHRRWVADPEVGGQVDGYTIDVSDTTIDGSDTHFRASGTATFVLEGVHGSTGESVTEQGSFEVDCSEPSTEVWPPGTFTVTVEVDGDTHDMDLSSDPSNYCIVFENDVAVTASDVERAELAAERFRLEVRPLWEFGSVDMAGHIVSVEYPGGDGAWTNEGHLSESPAFQVTGYIATWAGELHRGRFHPDQTTSKSFNVTIDCSPGQ